MGCDITDVLATRRFALLVKKSTMKQEDPVWKFL